MVHDARDVGDRIEGLLGGLRAGPDRAAAEELVRLLVGMYGEALERVMGVLADRPDLIQRLAEDELLEGLLILHDLHPLDVDARVQRALDRVRPYLGSHAGGVEYLGVDGDGVAQLRLEGNCDGCPSSTLTVKMAIEGAIRDAAPELTGVEVAGVTEPEPSSPLLQIGMGPPAGWDGGGTAAAGGSTGGSTGWSPLPATGPPTDRPVSVTVEGVPVLVCAVRGTLYAYRDACPRCGSALGAATLDGAELACPGCAARYDVRLAGRALDDSPSHLDPLPLLSDSKGVRVALPRAVAT